VGVRGIARRLGRSPSTISRELCRNASTRSHSIACRATTAQWHAERRASRPKVSQLAANDALPTYVHDRLAGAIARPDGSPIAGPEVRWIGRRHGRRTHRRWAQSWSPEQIANRLPLDFPDDPSMRISHEAIYQSLYVQGRGALRRELTACLRTGRALRVPRARTRGRGKGFVRPEIMISERPAEAEDRAVPGQWEGDLILGLESSAIGTLVERTTRYVMLLHLPRMNGHGAGPRVKNGPALAGHGAEAVRDAIASSILTLPEHDECEETPRTRVGNRSSGYAASAIADAQPSIAGEGTTMRPVNSQRCDDRLNSGPYDLIAVVEFPDDATLTAFLLAVGSQGNIRTTTLRAFNRDEVAEILQRTP
jgi:hypothetical protein